MKLIVEKENTARIPEVGEVWCHNDDTHVYMRINDNDGRLALTHKMGRSCFYSVELYGKRVASIVYTSKDSIDDVNILGKFKFVKCY
jgi:hypothetical protein